MYKQISNKTKGLNETYVFKLKELIDGYKFLIIDVRHYKEKEHSASYHIYGSEEGNHRGCRLGFNYRNENYCLQNIIHDFVNKIEII